jgi:hypothetical protein
MKAMKSTRLRYRVFGCSLVTAVFFAQIIMFSRLNNLGELLTEVAASPGEAFTPSITIYTVPKPFIGDDAWRQRRAIESWINVGSSIKEIVFLGYDQSYKAIVEEFSTASLPIVIEREIDINFLGVPFYNSVFLRAMASKTDVAVVLNGDINLMSDLLVAVRKLQGRFDDWFAIAARWDVDDTRSLLTNLMEVDRRQEIRNGGIFHTYGGVDTFIFNVKSTPLTSVQMPSFTYGRGKFDNWIVHESVVSGLRDVIDVSQAITTYHRTHTYAHMEASRSLATAVGKENKTLNNYWSQSKKSSWELWANIVLAESTGSYHNQLGQSLSTNWVMTLCADDRNGSELMCLIKRKRPGVCNCEYSPFVSKTQTDPVYNAQTKVYECGKQSVDKLADYVIPVNIADPPVAGLPHTAATLLEHVATNNTVIFTAVTYEYRDMVMSFICNLRKLKITNFLIAALDEDMYRFAFVRGLPVYFENFDGLLSKAENDAIAKVGAKGCEYGTQCFKSVTKLKSRSVLRILKLGYNVLWSDADIVWFKDATLPLLTSRGSSNARLGSKSVLLVQSNEPDIKRPANGIRRINSGFYLATSDAPTIKYFTLVISEASKTNISEQPTFYDVGCGKKGEFRVGDDACLNDDFGIQLIDRRKYPNGAVLGIWNTSSNIETVHPALMMLHNNWITGHAGKMERQMKHGLYFYHEKYDICLWSWTKRLPLL